MEPDTAAAAATNVDKEFPSTQPELAPQPSRRRWRASFGGAFLDGPNRDRYANQWLLACGQGG
jgi:hypothetical protein